MKDMLFFPQMRPEKKVVNDPVEKYTAAGIPEEWVPVIQKMGYITVEALKKLAPGKFFNDLCGFNKKNIKHNNGVANNLPGDLFYGQIVLHRSSTKATSQELKIERMPCDPTHKKSPFSLCSFSCMSMREVLTL